MRQDKWRKRYKTGHTKVLKMMEGEKKARFKADSQKCVGWENAAAFSRAKNIVRKELALGFIWKCGMQVVSDTYKWQRSENTRKKGNTMIIGARQIGDCQDFRDQFLSLHLALLCFTVTCFYLTYKSSCFFVDFITVMKIA